MRALSRKAIAVTLGTGLLVLLVLAGVGLASRPAAPNDFAPFTMRVTWWTAAAMQRLGSAPEAGTAVQLLEYRNIDSWRLAVLSSSWDPGVVGTSIEVNNGTHSTFLAQARRLVSRVIPTDEPSMAPYRWVSPGALEALPQQGFVPMAGSPAGTVAFIESSATTARRPDGSIGIVSGTVVVFDAVSHLPQSVKTYGDGTLRESLQFEVVSRP